MFIYSMRCRHLKRKLLIAAVAVVLCLTAAVGTVKLRERRQLALVSAQRELGLETMKAPDNTARLNFLSTLGWEVEQEPAEVVEVVIPQEFGDVYQNYNQIQKQQGLDLTPYRGKKVKRYTYVVNNYPGRPENIRANLLIYRDKIIGGDICSLEAKNGFMHGFSLPA